MPEEIRGMVYDIQPFSVQDGPGIRTTVFLKGCPLRCPWCHSPESQEFFPQLSWISMRCVGTEVCENSCITACTKAALEPGKESADTRTGQAIRLVQNAERVSNICNDVVGDICGIVSGAMGAAIIGRLVVHASDAQTLFYNVFLSALIAAITVGGKAFGKQFAMRYSKDIVFMAARVYAFFQKR